jgi:dihydropyrimidinase
MHELVIRNGTVVTATDMFGADIGVDGGVITALAPSLSGRTEIDAKGKLVIPGGVDSHCHAEQRMSGGVVNADDLFTATRSAACGGTTTVICFTLQPRDGTLADIVPAYTERAQRCAVDYAFHLWVTNPTEAVLTQELPALIAAGHRSVKVFMTGKTNWLDDLSLLKVLSVARAEGALVTVHAENWGVHQFLGEKLAEGGFRHPKYQAVLKPGIAEREAVHRIASFAELLDVPIQVFHVSAPEAAAEIEAAQKRGARVMGETCAQYLLLSAADLNRPGFEAAKFVFGPAPRGSAERGSLWDYLKRGVLDVVTSDHAPVNFDAADGKKRWGEECRVDQIPNGIPGVETRMSILWSEGVAAGRIDPPTFVALSSTNAAKTFGLHPRKGTIAVGADADLVVWDPHRTERVTNAVLHHAVDYTPYEGMTLTGWAETTLLRGQVVFHQGRYLGHEGQGRWLHRAPYDLLRPTGRFPGGYDPFAQRVTHPDLQ